MPRGRGGVDVLRRSISDGVTQALHMAMNGLDARTQAISGNVANVESALGADATSCDPRTGATDVCYFDETADAAQSRWFLSGGKEEKRGGNCQ